MLNYLLGVIDRELMSMHMFTATAIGSGTIAFEITVLDENDNTPTFREGIYFNITVSEDAVVSSGCG